MAKQSYRSSRNVVYSSKCHVLWRPKYRRQVLAGRVEERFTQIITEICAEHSICILGLEVMPDHVDLLEEPDPAFCISRLVRLVKGRSARWLCQEFPHLRRLPSLWTNSVFISTVGGAPLAVVKRYVENEKVA